MASTVLIAITITRVVALCIGALCFYLAYKLFFVNVEQQGHLEASGLGVKLKLRKVAPGIFFALMGTIIMALSARPISYSESDETPNAVAGPVWHREQMAGAVRQAPEPTRAPRK